MILLTSRLQGICNLSKLGRTTTILLSTCLGDSGSVRHVIKTNSYARSLWCHCNTRQAGKTFLDLEKAASYSKCE
jgi:hypothetical protein